MYICLSDFLLRQFSFLGQKFPKSLEISLTGTVTFRSMSKEQPVDPICTGSTAYVKVSCSLYES